MAMDNYAIITVPDRNDSMARVVLNETEYMIRFTYNYAGDYWKFGIYTAMDEPIAIGVKIVPNFPLNVFYTVTGLPLGVFAAITNLDRIGRNDFKDGKARFIFAPAPSSGS